VLDGRPSSRRRSANRPLAELLRRLPALRTTPAAPEPELERLADEIERVEWELPPGVQSIDFHLLGVDGRRWQPPPSDELCVLSPFLSDRALDVLAETTSQPTALIARAEALAELESPSPFGATYVMHEAAEEEDGEDADEARAELGLHAKAYITRTGRKVTLHLGSANATDAALLAGHNVELMVALTGTRRALGTPSSLVDPERQDGLGPLLTRWEPGLYIPPEAEKQRRRDALERAKAALAAVSLAARCVSEGDRWRLRITPSGAPALDEVDAIRLWPVALRADRAVDGAGLARGEPVALPPQELEGLTGLVAVELGLGEERLAFTLNLPVEDLPEARDRAILRRIVENKESFLRYLLMLLSGLGEGLDARELAAQLGRRHAPEHQRTLESFPLLEEMVRAYSRDPARLTRVRRLVADLTADEAGAEALPEGFLELWRAFETALDEESTN